MQQSGPKTFISYCGQNQDLAQKLKEDLTRAGCDPWQFDLSATPGTDAWGAIIERIENSDFFIVILSKAATTSRAVKEEIGHAHYCSINNSEGRPRIIPLTTEDGITVPRQIVRQVRLPFRQIQYNSDFERLLSALGLADTQRVRAQNSEQEFRQSTGRTHFLSASEVLRRGENELALAYLARAMRIDPANASARTRLVTLLGQQSWPVILRTFTTDFPVAEILLHPDRRRVVIGSSRDAYEARGISTGFWCKCY